MIDLGIETEREKPIRIEVKRDTKLVNGGGKGRR